MRTILLLLLAPVAVSAQLLKEEPLITAKFRMLAFSEPIDGGYTVSKGWTPLLITSDFLTAEQTYRGPADVTLVKRTPSGSTQPLASTRLTEGAQLILLLTPDGNGGQKVLQLNDTPGTFPFGTVRLFNLTGRPLGLRHLGEAKIIAAGDELVVRPTPDARGYATFELLTQMANEWGRAYSLRLFPQKDVRTIYFVLPGPPDSHAVGLKGVEERRQPDASPSSSSKESNNTPSKPDASR
jgi:hypothetical protein